MADEQTNHFDVDVIEPESGRTRRVQVERNHQLGSPRWRIYVSGDGKERMTNDELAEYLKQQTIELRRVADRLEDLAALMVTGRRVVRDGEHVTITPADVGELEELL